MTSDELVGVIAELGGAARIVTGSELRDACRARGIDIGTRPDGSESGGRITTAEQAELSSAAPRIVKWKALAGSAVGFTLIEAPRAFAGWNVHPRDL